MGSHRRYASSVAVLGVLLAVLTLRASPAPLLPVRDLGWWLVSGLVLTDARPC